MRRILLTTGFLAALAGPGFAADLPVKAPGYAPAAVFSWTGLYIGGNVGYGWGSGTDTTTITGVGTFTSGTGAMSGIIGGGQIGFNWQTSNFVFGVEGDWQASGLQRSTTTVPAAGVTVTETDSLPSFATIRGRLGLAMDTAMFYVTGGAAFVNTQSTITVGVAGAGTATLASATQWTSGWTAGGGVEWALNRNWSVKAEYLYLSTGSNTATGAIPAALGGGTFTNTTTVTDNIVRAGVNYRF